jgi:RNA polymerase sigma-70 factor (family 1)
MKLSTIEGLDYDSFLAAQVKKGNQLAFATLFNQYHKPLYQLAYRYLKSQEMTEDAVQHVFVKFWENRSKINEDQNVKSLLFTSLKNHTLNVLRDNARAVEKNYEILMEVSQSESSTDDAETTEMTDIIEQAVKRLSPQRRQIFYLKIEEGLSNQDIAEKLKISVNTVKFQYYQILKEIKEYATSTGTTLLPLFLLIFK